MRISQAVIVPIWILSIAGFMVMVKLLKTSPAARVPQNSVTPSWHSSLIVGLLIVAFLGWFSIPEYARYRRLVRIQQHGVRAIADVDSIYKGDCTRSGCSLHATYHYMAGPLSSGLSERIEGEDYLGRDELDDPHYLYASATKHLPVAYDRLAPNNSAINFDNQVFSTDQTRHFLSGLWVLGMFMLTVAPAVLIGMGAVLKPKR